MLNKMFDSDCDSTSKHVFGTSSIMLHISRTSITFNGNLAVQLDLSIKHVHGDSTMLSGFIVL